MMLSNNLDRYKMPKNLILMWERTLEIHPVNKAILSEADKLHTSELADAEDFDDKVATF